MVLGQERFLSISQAKSLPCVFVYTTQGRLPQLRQFHSLSNIHELHIHKTRRTTRLHAMLFLDAISRRECATQLPDVKFSSRKTGTAIATAAGCSLRRRHDRVGEKRVCHSRTIGKGPQAGDLSGLRKIYRNKMRRVRLPV